MNERKTTMTMKYSTIIAKTLCALTLSVASQQIHASQQFALKGDKNWNGDHEFTVSVAQNGQNLGQVCFKSDQHPDSYDLQMNNQNFPSLDLKNQNSCQSFYGRLERYIQQMSITNRTYKYKGRMPDGRIKAIRLTPETQTVLGFQLQSCHLIPNYPMGNLDLEIKVLLGASVDNLILDITSKIANIPSLPIPFTETLSAQDGSVVCVNGQGEVLQANGSTRHYVLPQIPGAAGASLVQAEEKVVANYQPSITPYKGSFFATIFPKNPQGTAVDVLESCSDSEDDWGYTSVGGFSESSSMSAVDGDYFIDAKIRQLSIPDPYKFYKIEGAPVEIPAAKNPFMVLDKNGQAYFTWAFQETCYPFVDGIIDRSAEYVLQRFVKTSISGGNHYCSGGIGLRRTIYDGQNLPLYPNAYQSKSLDKAHMAKDVLKIRQEQDAHSVTSYNKSYVISAITYPANFVVDSSTQYYDTLRNMGQEAQKMSQDFQGVFVSTDKELLWNLHSQKYILYDKMPSSIQGSQLQKLTLLDEFDQYNSSADLRKLATAFSTLSQLTDLHIKMQSYAIELYGLLKTLPKSIETLTIEATTGPGQYATLSGNLYHLSSNPLPRLKKFFYSGKASAFTPHHTYATKGYLGGLPNEHCCAIGNVGYVIQSHPQLVEINLDLQMPDHKALAFNKSELFEGRHITKYSPDQMARHWINSSFANQNDYILDNESPSKFINEMVRNVPILEKAILEHPNLKIFKYRKNTLPKGARITLNRHTLVFHVTTCNPADECNRLVSMFSVIGRKPGLQVIIQ